jgi:L-aminopeptidase/D-esterase-like protein
LWSSSIRPWGSASCVSSRAIDPFHTIHDGDVLYAVTTNELGPPPVQDLEISYMASELAWDAVLASF